MKKQIDYPATLAECAACPLADMGPAVGGDYRAPDWDILVVMRNPGEREKEVGLPAVGPTGMLLRKFLRDADILHRCAITNLVKHHTPKNRPPTDKEIRACEHWLKQEVEQYGDRVRLVLCVGFESAKFAGGFKGAIGKNVGTVRHTSTLIPDAPSYAIYHPSYLFRKRGTNEYRALERQMRNCLSEVKKIADEGHVLPDHEYRIADAIDLAGSYAIDTEYTDDQRTSAMRVASIYAPDHGTIVTRDVRTVTGNPTMHFAQADLPVLMRHADVRPDKVDDTMVMAWALGETDLRLKFQAHKQLGMNMLTYEEAVAIGGWDIWGNYWAQDAVATWGLRENLLPRLEALPRIKDIYDNIDSPLQMILARMSLDGIRIDHAALLTKMTLAERTMERLSETIKLMAGWDINPNSPDQIAYWLYDQLHLKKPRKRPDEKHPPTDAPTLKKLHHRAADLILAYRHVEDLLSRYLRPMSMLLRISGIWNITGTEAGRVACSKRNLTNQPPDVDELLIPDDGMVFVSGDYNQLELRIGAYLSRDPKLIEVLSSVDEHGEPNRDLHGELCVEVYGHVEPKLRTRAKSSIFERMYGGGEGMLAKILNISMREASHIFGVQDQFLAGFIEYAEVMKQAARDLGYAETQQGFRRWLHDADSDDEFIRHKADKEAINTPIQGTGGIATKKAMVILDPWLAQLDGKYARQVHDSIDIMVPLKYEEDAKLAVKESMLAAIPAEMCEVLPFFVKVTSGQNL